MSVSVSVSVSAPWNVSLTRVVVVRRCCRPVWSARGWVSAVRRRGCRPSTTERRRCCRRTAPCRRRPPRADDSASSTSSTRCRRPPPPTTTPSTVDRLTTPPPPSPPPPTFRKSTTRPLSSPTNRRKCDCVYAVKTSAYKRIFCGDNFDNFTEPVPYRFVSANRRPASLFRRFTDINVQYGTGSVKIWKTRHKIYADLRIFYSVVCTTFSFEFFDGR